MPSEILSLTNGGAFQMALYSAFPEFIYVKDGSFTYIYKDKKHFELRIYLTKVSSKWWNTSYEAESEVEECMP